MPELKLVARSDNKEIGITCQTGHRFSLGNIIILPGAIDLPSACPGGSGVRFVMKEGEWYIVGNGDLVDKWCKVGGRY